MGAGTDNSTDWPRTLFRPLLCNAAMPLKDKLGLQCRECGSRAFVIHGPTIKNDIVLCAECRAEFGSLDEFRVMVEASIKKQNEPRRRCH